MSFPDIVARLWKRVRPAGSLTCASVAPLLSAYIDSMAEPEEARGIESHLAVCGECHAELKSLNEMQNFLVSTQRPEVPTHFDVDAGTRLAQARHAGRNEGIAAAILDLIQPMAIRAALGVSVSVILFGAISIGLTSQTFMMTNPGPDPGYRAAYPTEDAKVRIAGNDAAAGLKGSLVIVAFVEANGYVSDFRIVEGAQDVETKRMVWDRLFYAQFHPAKSLGMPVSSSVILSFVAVKS